MATSSGAGAAVVAAGAAVVAAGAAVVAAGAAVVTVGAAVVAAGAAVPPSSEPQAAATRLIARRVAIGKRNFLSLRTMSRRSVSANQG